MASTRTETTREPTAAELTIIDGLEGRIRSALVELRETQAALTDLATNGIVAAERVDVSDEIDNLESEALDVRGLSVVRALDAFYEWWFFRLREMETLGHYEEDVCEDPTRNKSMQAIDRAVADLDAEAIAILGTLFRVRDDSEGVARILAQSGAGTLETFTLRVEAVLARLIGSGWRP